MRDALIACNTSSQVARPVALESLKQISPWYARVPTDSNYSDGPSRLDTSKVLAMGAADEQIDEMDCWAQHLALARKWGELQA